MVSRRSRCRRVVVDVVDVVALTHSTPASNGKRRRCQRFWKRRDRSRLEMACLYIDRLKRDFQRAHRFGQRANNGEVWCPLSSINRLCNYKCEDAPEVSTNASISVKFNPAVPKIFAIGLHPDRRDTRKRYFSLITIKELLKRYLAYLVRRYRSYFRSPSKLVRDENCHRNACAFGSFVSIVSKCSKEFANKNIWDTDKESSRATLRCKCKHRGSPNGRPRDAQAFSRSVARPNFPDERYIEHPRDRRNARNKDRRCGRTVEEVNSKDGRSSSRIDRTVSSSRSNASGDARFEHEDSPISVTKRSVGVQTSRKSDARRKDRRKKICGRNRKERSAPISTKTPFPRDVETIFKANSEDFDWEDSNLNLDPWGTKGKRRSNASIDENGSGNSETRRLSEARYSRSEGDRDSATIHWKCAKRDRSVATIRTILTNECHDMEPSETEISKEVQVDENRAPSNASGVVLLANSIEVEDKSSETIILGNIKKRLEEDYDDYFSFDEYVMEDGFDVSERFAGPTPSIDRTSSDGTIHYSMAEDASDAATWTRKDEESPSGRRKPKRSEENSKYSFSVRCIDSSSSRSRSSYYTLSQDRDCSQCSSTEFCSASNDSFSNFSRVGSNFYLPTILGTHPLNTFATRNRAHEISPLSTSSPYDFLLKSDPILRSSGESLDEATVDSRLARIRRRRSSSTKNAFKMVSESFDSGVLLTDCSRDHILCVRDSLKIGRAGRNCRATEPNLLPTYDFGSNSSYSDESLDRRLDVVVKQFTDNLVLTERKVRLKLRRLEKPSRSRQRRRRQGNESRRQRMQKPVQSDSSFNFYWSQDDDKIASSSTPPIFSLSDSEIDHA
ncbi:uncharacterized protein LOC143258729 isoform X1 [Megalopta genalis]|uniref:uncharacterized protein LOC143258729 isoform X1 n=2 Tax=Megalopta genalis TaxID=115081 RepID=UPI003FCF408F